MAALRTNAVFSAHDTNLLPLVLSAPRFISLGPGTNLYDFTAAANVAHALYLTAKNLCTVLPAAVNNQGSAAGKAFFVTNAEPVPFRGFLEMVWEADDEVRGARRGTGKKREKERDKGKHWCVVVPVSVAVWLIWILEKLMGWFGKEPGLTERKLGDSVADRWFHNGNAMRVLGYEPIVGVQDAVKDAVGGYVGFEKSKVQRE